MNSLNVLEINGLKKSFGSKKVLNGLDLFVPEKKIYGFVGRNGAGKTTTMKLVLGLLAPDGGSISVHGEKVVYGNTPTNKYIGYLPDVPEFYSYMTPKEYLRFCGEISGMDKKDIASRSEELLSLVGLGNEKHRIKGFSRGMKQRLGIAQALLGRPKLLICDEPTSALDPVGRKDILNVLVSAKEETTILFSTHILSDVEHICDDMALLNDGKVIMQGSIDEIRKKRRDDLLKIYLERPEDTRLMMETFRSGLKESENCTLVLENSAMLPEILRFIADKGIAFSRLEKQEATLEDIFLDAIGS